MSHTTISLSTYKSFLQYTNGLWNISWHLNTCATNVILNIKGQLHQEMLSFEDVYEAERSMSDVTRGTFQHYASLAMQHWAQRTRGAEARKELRDRPVVLRRRRERVKSTANWPMFYYQFHRDHALPNLIWNHTVCRAHIYFFYCNRRLMTQIWLLYWTMSFVSKFLIFHLGKCHRIVLRKIHNIHFYGRSYSNGVMKIPAQFEKCPIFESNLITTTVKSTRYNS